MNQHKVIYDTDPGVDDAMAFVFQALDPEIELLGVTSVFGNAAIDVTTRNALYLAARFAPAVPVARGAAAPLSGSAPVPLPAIHGEDGLGNTRLAVSAAANADPRAASRFIVDTVREYPGEVTLLAVGPLTNLALALDEGPDIARLVKRVVVMGGAFGFGGIGGNVSPAAEANMFADPLAADIVFGADWPIAIVGLDVTQRVIMTTQYLESLGERGGEAGRFVRDISLHYEAFHFNSESLRGIYVHDASAAIYVVAPEYFTTRSGPVRVLTDGIAAGHTIQKPGGMPAPAPAWDHRPACGVCVGVDADAVLARYERTICGVR
ncbi:nucleoside hydrolase [Trinickia caryophylli]|uniref:Inosine-uridine nucleoside N-ribohydrolase n=1 Tax=Trinickia caryophylli TaxID=28094 RepID=A0A1X7G2N0_TRICW|nr:nucleoside hydrolase [Trinickia caryophylli]PMS13716.1 nucleoside hydrolase [Trinickia caryophylli]TRX14209.1 nucleoside hydrolase [Trinickia caryophylli]WQE14035.1 nucleoside hydrolase [Trinickia caryophylli]SMF62933.1 Inosine-uridine nucleoside N-ribohydrolase [Trinickia caryophylli]GLU33477.1 inosine-uridine preferring nucleoside hydrolase [Trinickia caryophylli]